MSQERGIEHSVIIAGAGPTGLMLAGELAVAGVDVAIIERRESEELSGLRAGGLHIRTVELLDQRGIAERFLAQGQVARRAPFARSSLDLSDLPTRHNYFLALWQTRIERTLADWVSELGVPVYRGCDVADFTQDAAGVEISLSDGRSAGANYLVGCDGGRSTVRKKSGIEFPGYDAATTWLIAEIGTSEAPAWGIRSGRRGINAIAKLEDDKHARAVLSEDEVRHGDPDIADVRAALVRIYGTDYGLQSATYISRFSDMTRQAACYRKGRVLLAGDAAHVHSPMGGQGLNLGVQDAVNLGWKLAQVVHGISPDSLLDTYHAERHPAGARVLRNTMALATLEREEDRAAALREMLLELLQRDEPRQQYVSMISGLDIQYALGDGHPLLGRRMPDLDLVTAEGDRTVFSLLRDGRPVFLNFGDIDASEMAPWGERVKNIKAESKSNLQIPAIGQVAIPGAVLIRPDGHVAWAGEQGQQGLRDALARWFGARPRVSSKARIAQ